MDGTPTLAIYPSSFCSFLTCSVSASLQRAYLLISVVLGPVSLKSSRTNFCLRITWNSVGGRSLYGADSTPVLLALRRFFRVGFLFLVDAHSVPVSLFTIVTTKGHRVLIFNHGASPPRRVPSWQCDLLNSAKDAILEFERFYFVENNLFYDMLKHWFQSVSGLSYFIVAFSGD